MLGGCSFYLNQCSLLLGHARFAEDERTLATTVACNADVLGIAVAYLVSPLICQQINHVPYLLQIIAILSFGMVRSHWLSTCAMLLETLTST